jgi:hypothetical protein
VSRELCCNLRSLRSATLACSRASASGADLAVWRLGRTEHQPASAHRARGARRSTGLSAARNAYRLPAPDAGTVGVGRLPIPGPLDLPVSVGQIRAPDAAAVRVVGAVNVQLAQAAPGAVDKRVSSVHVVSGRLSVRGHSAPRTGSSRASRSARSTSRSTSSSKQIPRLVSKSIEFDL